MYDELTEVDIKKMQEEINYRTRVLRPQLIEEVQTARAFGDLSENYEYKCAKQAKNRNDSRIRYLERMIRTAKVIEVKDQGDRAGLFDKVTIYNELAKQEMTLQIVTTLRQDALKGLISKESPVGKALLGRQVGDRIQVEVSPEVKYWVEIRAIEKGRDDESLEISSYRADRSKEGESIMLFLWYPKCTTCQKAKAFLDERGVSYEARDIKLENPTAEELRGWWEKSGMPLKKFFNTSGLQYKALGLKDKLPEMSEEEQLALLATDGMLVKRPILVGEDFVRTGFRQAEWETALG